MIPREILKKIRQIELRPNRIVTGSVDGGCVRSISRSTPELYNAPTNRHALRPGLRPQPRSVRASQNSKPIEFEGFGNYDEIAIIKNQADKPTPVLIPSNSTGLKSRVATNSRN